MQGNLFDIDTGPGAFGQPRDELPHCGKPTSREAAVAAEPRAGTWRRAVLDYIRSRGEEGATRDETCAALGLGGNTVRPRFLECEKAGWIRNTGTTRLNVRGYKTEVYVATDIK
jgi:hypothetical protein